MSSGIMPDKEVEQYYQKLHQDKEYRFLVFKFSDGYKSIVVDKENGLGGKDATFADLKKGLPKDHVRYIAYDIHYTTVSGQTRDKVLIVSWSSDDDAPLKEKMLTPSSVPNLLKVCKKAAKHVTINDWDELTEENFINLVSDNRTK